MGLAAKSKYPDLDFSTSVMVGNTTSDMRFGRNLGMRTVFITSTSPAPEESGLADDTYESLWQFSLSC
jgi:histidinol phosphatase-like enzyme